MIKMFLILGIIICGVTFGIIIHNHLFNKVRIFKDFEKICKDITSEISFLKTEKYTLLKKQTPNNQYSAAFLNQYLLSGKGNITLLKEKENNILNEFLDSVGNKNVDGEIYNLEYYEKIIKEYMDDMQEKYNKYGVLSIKLSIILSALLVIILL